jgi:lichenan operon transcriptional antiterminator
VSVVALVAFSEEGRTAFQTVFEQFVEVFADRADVQRLLHGSTDFASFIDQLVLLIDS